MERPKTQFILNGFAESAGSRVFRFEGVEADKTRAAFSVNADLELSRKHGIRLQELPLLCQSLLESRHLPGGPSDYTFSDEDMGIHAAEVSARREASKKKRPPRNRTAPNTATPWRASQHFPSS